MRHRASLCLLLGLAIVGCSRQPVASCESTGRYAAARSAPPVQIPDDLSPPNESDALRLPPEAAAATASGDHCLESPPLFSRDSRLGRRGTEARTEPPTEEPAAEPPPDPNRVIDN